MINFQKTVLPNGLRVIAAPMESTQAATLLALVGVGSRYETKNISGLSHFLEHLFFKGTKSRPRVGQIHGDLDKIGASHNAFTSKETTGFWVKAAAKDFDTGLDIVSDILLEPLFKEEEIEKERGVILQEISMYEDQPQRKVWDILENTMYGDQPVGWDVAGTKETVSGIKRADILEYRQRNYLSENTVVVAAGAVKPDAVFKKIEKHFGGMEKGKNQQPEKAAISQEQPRVAITDKDSDQTHVAMGLLGCDMYDERRYALNLMAVILGGNCSSRFFMEIREKLGLAYYVFSHGDQYTDCGYLGIGTGVSHNNLEKTVQKIKQILGAIKREGVSENELAFSKSYLRGQMALAMETSDEVASFCAAQELFYKKIEQPEEILRKIEKVNQSDILKIADEVFRPENINVAVVGKQAAAESFLKNLFSKI